MQIVKVIIIILKSCLISNHEMEQERQFEILESMDFPNGAIGSVDVY